jgi:hypothetical protein
MTKASERQAWPAALGLSVAAALVLCLASGLWPLAAVDRQALALFALCLALPLGAALGRVQGTPRDAGTRAAAGLLAGLVLATLLTLPDPALWVRTASWCAAAALLGCAVGGLAGAAGMAATLGWLGLCGLPFFCGRLGALAPAAESLALWGCPWLGFSADALGGDPLRRPVIYLGQWSSLGDKPALGLLQAWHLWFMAALALCAALARAALPARAATAIVSPDSRRDHDSPGSTD